MCQFNQFLMKNQLHKINLTVYFWGFLDYTVVKIYRAFCGLVSYDNVRYASDYLGRISSRQLKCKYSYKIAVTT